jgi:hypothetical protein
MASNCVLPMAARFFYSRSVAQGVFILVQVRGQDLVHVRFVVNN